MKTIVVIVCLVVIGAGLGCAAFSDAVTPATLDQRAKEYVVEGGAAGAGDFEGYPNLAKAKILAGRVDAAHLSIQLDLHQQLQTDTLMYGTIKDAVTSNVTMAQQREETLFGEKGLLSMGLGLAGFGTLTGFLGLMRKRPGDVTSAELNQAVTQATSQSSAEVQAKTKAFTEVVQSVAAIMDELEGAPITLDKIKVAMNGIQDTDTQKAVSAVKATLNL